MPDVKFSIAFVAGIISFFAPCVLPLIPSYIAYVSGISLNDLKVFGYPHYLKRLLVSSLFYILGFSLVFVLLGTTAASIGIYLRRYDFLIQRIGGVIILIMGLELSGFVNLSLLAKERKAKLPKWTDNWGYLRSFLVGFIFATAWTPCVGVILGSILTLAAVSKTAFQGATLLFVYSLGILIPFMIVSLTLASAPKYLKIIGKHIGIISKISGMFLAFLGLLLFTDTYKYLNAWLFEIAFRLGYRIR